MHTITIPELYDLFLKHPSVCTDSRSIKQGDLFFALKGPSFNGNQFALEALKKGAAWVIADEALFDAHPRILFVQNVLTTLQQLAKHHRLQLNIPVIAITGSNGKTTTKELVAQVLSAKYHTLATEGNQNNHIGVPLTLLKISSDTEMAIIEMGANHQGEIATYCEIALPGYGLITNCGKAHLEGFGGIEGVRKAKGELYDFIRKFEGSIFRCADLDYLEKMSTGIEHQVTYGSANAQITGRALTDGFFLQVAVLSAGMETTIHTKLVGEYNLPNVLAAIAVGHYFGMVIDEIKKAIESYAPSNSRSQLILKGANRIISDAYNANPASMKSALQNLAGMEAEQKWLMLGSMKEMGNAEHAEHQALIDLAVQLGFENVILVGKEFSATRHNFQWFEDADIAVQFLQEHPVSHALILVKGSRGAQMEKILAVL